MAPNNSNSDGHIPMDQIITACGNQNIPPPKSRTEYSSDLGTYKAAVTPLLVLFLGLTFGTYSFYGHPTDPRITGWFLMDRPISMIVLAVVYILFSMVWGPQYMRDRKPWPLRSFMIAYNAFQVFASLYMFIETGMSGWFFDYNFRCQPCDYSTSDKALRMAHVAHWYFLSKILDFADTILFIVRGKFNQVTNLHVIHHSCMFISMWIGIRHMPGGHITFMGFLNTFVHTVMYSYYLLSAMGDWIKPYLWWKKYLTKLQLVQFVAIFLHAAQLLVFPCDGLPSALVLWTLLYAFIFFALFINFYIKAYLFGDKRSKLRPQNPTTKTEVIKSSNGSAISSLMDARVIHRTSSTAVVL